MEKISVDEYFCVYRETLIASSLIFQFHLFPEQPYEEL